MIKFNYNNKKIILLMGFIYILLNIILINLFINTEAAKSILSTKDMKTSFGNNMTIIIFVLVIFMSIGSIIFMTFIYRNLLKFIFTESCSWKSINFCYLFSVISGCIVSIIILLINNNVEITTLSKLTNATTAIIMNILFYLFNKINYEQILIIIISTLNAGITFFI